MVASAASARGSLSVCCLVGDPPERVAAMLELVRPVADELVVAVDAASPAAESPRLAELADRFYRVEFALPFEQYLAWLHSTCRCEWVLRLDGDEVPSAALVAALRGLAGERSVLQYRLPRRWLFRQADRWIAQEPWYPDHQIRLVRNDPATLRFRGVLHSSAEPVLPARYIAEPIYHLALLVSSEHDRERRVARYAELPVMPGVDNELFYLPERSPDVRLAATPAEDRTAIERVLGAAAEPRAPVSAGRFVAFAEMERHSALRTFDEGGYDVELTCLDEELELIPGAEREVRVLVQNRGTETLPFAGGPPNVRASYHWRSPAGDVVVADGERTLLTCDIGPGSSAVVPVRVVAPAEPGEYVLELDLVHEEVRWFERSARIPVRVGRRRRRLLRRR